MIKFKGSHFPSDIILLTLKWHFTDSFSYRELQERLKQRGMDVDHVTLNRWVKKYGSASIQNLIYLPTYRIDKWQLKKGHAKIKGQWFHYYQAINSSNKLIDFFLSLEPNLEMAMAFFAESLGSNSKSNKVNTTKLLTYIAELEAALEALNSDYKNSAHITKGLLTSTEKNLLTIKRSYKILKAMKHFF